MFYFLYFYFLIFFVVTAAGQCAVKWQQHSRAMTNAYNSHRRATTCHQIAAQSPADRLFPRASLNLQSLYVCHKLALYILILVRVYIHICIYTRMYACVSVWVR